MSTFVAADTAKTDSNTNVDDEGIVVQCEDGSFDVSNAVNISKAENRGGGVQDKDTKVEAKKEPTPLEKALSFKEEGNQYYREKNYEQAAVCYSDAINILAGSHGYDPEVFEREMKELNIVSNEKGSSNNEDGAKAVAAGTTDGSSTETFGTEQKKTLSNGERDKDIVGFENTEDGIRIPPEHRHHLAVFHCNRAACLLQLVRYTDVIDDCNAAIELNEKYTKAYLRRAQAFEALERPDDALKDMEEVCVLEPVVVQHRTKRDRLQQICNERTEKLKEETLGKLKDLGNSILNKFGMSLDNFNLKKDENTGSYSISYNNSPAP